MKEKFVALFALLTLAAPPLRAQSGPLAKVKPTELLKNPTFAPHAAGWRLNQGTFDGQVKHGVSMSVRLSGVKVGAGIWSHVGMGLKDVPVNRELQFTCYALGAKPGQALTINAFAYDDKMQVLDNWSQTTPLTRKAWTKLTRTYIAPTGTKTLTLFVMNFGAQPVHVADAHLLPGQAKQAALKNLTGPGLLRAMEQAGVKTEHSGQTGTITFPIPAAYRDQVPLAFTVKTVPAEALKGWAWRKREDGTNWLLDVQVTPPAKGCIVRYESLVLVGNHVSSTLPPAPRPEVPQEAALWTRRSGCVQSDDPAIRAKAAALGKDSPDVETYARRVIAFTSSNQGTGAAFTTLDASAAMKCGGSCTSRANLAAALLRAHGIPARTVAHLPTWSGPLYEHWLVEYWHPGAGWVWLESTLGEFAPPAFGLAVLNVANPDDEDKSRDPLHLRYVMPGAAYLSVIELSKELYPADLFKDDATNVAKPVVQLTGSEEEMEMLFARARTAYTGLTEQGRAGRISAESTKQIEAAAKSGKASDLAAVLTEK